LTLFTDGKFKVFTERDGLPSNSVRALYEDRDGTLWIKFRKQFLPKLKKQAAEAKP
jgi:hypothetical protein